RNYKIPGSSLEKIIVHSKGIYYFTKSYGKGFNFSIKMNEIDSSMSDRFLGDIVNSVSLAGQNIDIQVEANYRRDQFVIWYLLDTREQTLLKFHLYSDKQIKLESGIRLDGNPRQNQIKDIITDDAGNLYFVLS